MRYFPLVFVPAFALALAACGAPCDRPVQNLCLDDGIDAYHTRVTLTELQYALDSYGYDIATDRIVADVTTHPSQNYTDGSTIWLAGGSAFMLAHELIHVGIRQQTDMHDNDHSHPWVWVRNADPHVNSVEGLAMDRIRTALELRSH